MLEVTFLRTIYQLSRNAKWRSRSMRKERVYSNCIILYTSVNLYIVVITYFPIVCRYFQGTLQKIPVDCVKKIIIKYAIHSMHLFSQKAFNVKRSTMSSYMYNAMWNIYTPVYSDSVEDQNCIIMFIKKKQLLC